MGVGVAEEGVATEEEQEPRATPARARMVKAMGCILIKECWYADIIELIDDIRLTTNNDLAVYIRDLSNDGILSWYTAKTISQCGFVLAAKLHVYELTGGATDAMWRRRRNRRIVHLL